MPLSPLDEKVLGVVLDAIQPVTSSEVADRTGISRRQAQQSLRNHESLGDLFMVGEIASTGRPGLLWWHQSTYTATAPEPDPTPEEIPVPMPSTVTVVPPLVVPDSAPEPARAPAAASFEVVAYLKPGEVLLKSGSGTLYVARELIERR